MTKSDRVRPIVKVAQNREREAARVFADRQRMLQEREERLAEVRRYRVEYLENYQTRSRSGMSAQQMRTYRNFLQKLDAAIAQQEQLVDEARSELDHEKARWLEKHQRSKALDNMRARYVTQEQREAQRVEQKESDERGQRRIEPDE
ncbi:MAG: flagellar export protein FliJ [Gammaproteobacteria bacterium]|nr:flagellar export protein FliJ [Gammaproteobacteria bacterium]